MSITCDGCGMEPIEGLRWHCLSCQNFDLCTTCYMGDEHNLRHTFERLEQSRGKRYSISAKSCIIAALGKKDNNGHRS